jgi:hypothetical protein
MFRRDGALLARRGGSRGGGSPPAPTLAARILAAAPGAVRALYLSPAPGTGLTVAGCYTLTGTACDSWHDLSGNARHATAAGAARPTYSATAINSMPGLTLDGGDAVATAAVGWSSFTSLALISLFRDTDTAARFAMGIGVATDEAMVLVVNAGAAGDIDIYAEGTAGGGSTITRARSVATTYPMTTAGVVSGTWDWSLATNEAEIRHNGVNVTATRPNNSNNTSGLGTLALTLGAGPTLPITGAMAAAAVLGWTGTLGAAELAQIAAVEALLMETWGL